MSLFLSSFDSSRWYWCSIGHMNTCLEIMREVTIMVSPSTSVFVQIRDKLGAFVLQHFLKSSSILAHDQTRTNMHDLMMIFIELRHMQRSCQPWQCFVKSTRDFYICQPFRDARRIGTHRASARYCQFCLHESWRQLARCKPWSPLSWPRSVCLSPW